MKKKKAEREVKKKCPSCLKLKSQSEFYLSSHDKTKYRSKCKECEIIIKRKDEVQRTLKKLNAPQREGIVNEHSEKPVVSSRYLDTVSRNGDSLWLNISRVLASARNAQTSKTTALN